MPIYEYAGVRPVGLVDPDLPMLEAYALSENKLWTLLSTITNDDPVQSPPFDAISFPLDGMWA